MNRTILLAADPRFSISRLLSHVWALSGAPSGGRLRCCSSSCICTHHGICISCILQDEAEGGWRWEWEGQSPKVGNVPPEKTRAKSICSASMRSGWTAEECSEWAVTEPVSQTNTQRPEGLRERRRLGGTGPSRGTPTYSGLTAFSAMLFPHRRNQRNAKT